MLKNSDLNKATITPIAQAPLVSFQSVSKTYPLASDGEVALRDISLSVSSGEFVCIIGPSGCGKSTLLKIVAGLEEASSGTIQRPPSTAMVFQNAALFPWLSVIENAAIGLRAHGVPNFRARKIAHAFLASLGLAELAEKLPRELSGGQRQRVGIARALAVKPSLLLLDEPFSALDPKTTHQLHEDLLKMWRETGVTIIMISHLIEEAVSLGQRILLMENGSVTETFPVEIDRKSVV